MSDRYVKVSCLVVNPPPMRHYRAAPSVDVRHAEVADKPLVVERVTWGEAGDLIDEHAKQLEASGLAATYRDGVRLAMEKAPSIARVWNAGPGGPGGIVYRGRQPLEGGT